MSQAFWQSKGQAKEPLLPSYGSVSTHMESKADEKNDTKDENSELHLLFMIDYDGCADTPESQERIAEYIYSVAEEEAKKNPNKKIIIELVPGTRRQSAGIDQDNTIRKRKEQSFFIDFDSLFNCLKKKITNPNITVNATHTVSADYYNGKKAEFTYQSVKSISNMRYASLNKLPVTLVDYYKFDISYYHLHATAENNAKVFLIDDEVDTLFAQYDYFSTHPDLIPKGKNFTLVFHRSNQTYKPHIYKDPLDGSGAQIAQDQVADTLKHILLPVAGKKFSDMLSIFSCLSKNSGYETSLEIIESFKNKVNSYRGQDGRIDMDRVMVDQSKNTGYCGPCRCIVM